MIAMALAGLVSCSSPDKKENALATSTSEETADSLLITPGKSIGEVKLNDDLQALTNVLGKPDLSDAAMGGAAYTWFANHNEAGFRTSVYGHRNMGAADENIVHIKKILITDPAYKTADGINTGLLADSIRKKYTLGDSSVYAIDGKPRSLYTDMLKGIAFEVDPLNKRCTAISIFAPRDTASARINVY